MTQKTMAKNIQLCEDPYILCRFIDLLSTVHTTVLDDTELFGAVKRAKAIVADDQDGVWLWSYLFKSGKVVANIVGPSCVGASMEFVTDFLSKSKPVHLDITKGDALEP